MFELKEVLNVKTGLNKKYYESTMNKIRSLTPLTRIAAINLVAFLNEQNIGTVIVSDGYRTREEQNALYQLGRTKAGKKVTNCDGYINKSKHQTGMAFDIAIIKENKTDYSIETWKKVLFEMRKFKALFEMKYKKYELVLGGDFKSFKDMPHVEIKTKEMI